MKAILLASAILLWASALFAQTTFCISVSDPCCDGDSTLGSYQLAAQDNFDIYKIWYNTGSSNNKVRITCFLDTQFQWSRTFCGCGQTSVESPTANSHLIKIYVDCVACNPYGPTCDSNVTNIVKVSTENTSNCDLLCD